MENRRKFIISLGAWLTASRLYAQIIPKTHRVGVLSGGNRTANQVRFAAFEAGLRELGYTIGKTVHLDYRFADGEFSRLPSLAAEILRRKPDVLLAHTTPGSLAAKKATTNIPVVFVGVADPVGVGLVSSLSRPESNITGITNITAELAGKRLELLKEVVPQARQIAVFVNPNDANAQLQLHNVEAAARTIGISLGPVVHIRSVSDVSVAFEAAVKAGAQAGIRMVDPLSVVTRKPAADLALKYKLPVVFAFSQDVEAGGLLAYGPDIIEQFHRASTYIDKILKGAKPAELPIEQPMTFELAVNLKTARALGLTIPPEIMVRATRIIQ